MVTLQEFCDEFNFMLNTAVGELDIDNPDEMLYYKEAVAGMMMDNTGQVVEFTVINKKGQINLIGGDS